MITEWSYLRSKIPLIAKQDVATEVACLQSKSTGITPQVYNENNARYDEELSDLHRQEERLDEADKQFYITVGYLLAIFQHAERLFEVAKIDEKRQIIGLLLSNLQLEDKKLTFNLKEPFATVLSHANGSLWLGWRDSNPRMLGPEPSALPLGDTPSACAIVAKKSVSCK